MVNKKLVIGLIVGVFAVCAGGVWAQEEESSDPLQEIRDDTMTVVIDGHLHSTREILKIMNNSNLVYELGILPEDTVLEEGEPFVITETYQREESEDKITLFTSTLSDSAATLMRAGEDAFTAKDYPKALSLYRQALEQDSTSANGWTFVGDAFYMMGQYDSAVVAFKKAIELNYIDYDAHWFLADAYWELGNEIQALEEMTIAHVLNRNHVDLKGSLAIRRQQVGQPWKEWEFKPEYVLSSDGHNVTVRFKSDWMGYAMARALWKYEPRYREKMTGREPGEVMDSTTTSMLEERECLVPFLTIEDPFPELNKAVEAGYVDEFIWYEIWLKKYPVSLLMMPDIEEKVGRIVEYINKYH